jgi:hypothetical protein
MMALHASVGMQHDPLLVAASAVVAIAASGLALHLANGTSSGSRPPLLLSAAALGIAIAGMHYIAMAAVTITPESHGHGPVTAPAISADLLAIVVAIVAFIVSGLFLLILVPDRAGDPASTEGVPPPGPEASLVPPVEPLAARAPEPAGSGSAQGEGTVAAWLPVLHDGATIQMPVENVVAVHANAHYTYVFDGTDRYFCQLAISDVEHRLDPNRFARVHRSHIIAVNRIVRLRKTGDNGVVELSGRSSCTVPVSRSRMAWVRSQLAGKAASARPAAVSG